MLERKSGGITARQIHVPQWTNVHIIALDVDTALCIIMNMGISVTSCGMTLISIVHVGSPGISIVALNIITVYDN